MLQVLDAPQRDKAVRALRDIKGLLEHTQKKPEYTDLTEVQTILTSYGLQIAPIVKPAPLVLTPVPTAAQPTASAKVSHNDLYWLESIILKYQHAKANNINGYNFKNEVAGKILAILCPIAGIPFKP